MRIRLTLKSPLRRGFFVEGTQQSGRCTRLLRRRNFGGGVPEDRAGRSFGGEIPGDRARRGPATEFRETGSGGGRRRNSGRQGRAASRRENFGRQGRTGSGGAAPGDRSDRVGRRQDRFPLQPPVRVREGFFRIPPLRNKRTSLRLEGRRLDCFKYGATQRTTTSNNSTVPSIRTATTPAASSMRKKGAVTS